VPDQDELGIGSRLTGPGQAEDDIVVGEEAGLGCWHELGVVDRRHRVGAPGDATPGAAGCGATRRPTR